MAGVNLSPILNVGCAIKRGLRGEAELILSPKCRIIERAVIDAEASSNGGVSMSGVRSERKPEARRKVFHPRLRKLTASTNASRTVSSEHQRTR